MKEGEGEKKKVKTLPHSKTNIAGLISSEGYLAASVAEVVRMRLVKFLPNQKTYIRGRCSTQ